MKIRRTEDSARAKAKRRLSRLPDGEILDWAENAGRGIAEVLSEYRRYRDPALLNEVLLGVSTLGGAIDALVVRG